MSIPSNFQYIYYLSIVINLLALFKLIIKPIIKKGSMIFEDLCLIICMSYAINVGVTSIALSILLFTHGFIGGLNLYSGKIIWKKKSN